VLLPVKILAPVTVNALFIVVVPEEAPRDMVVAALAKFKVVTVELTRLKVVAVEVISPPFTAKSLVRVVFPATPKVPERVVALETAKVPSIVEFPAKVASPSVSTLNF